jgi:hypothetical protein
MLTYIGIIALVIIILAIYQYRQAIVVEDNVEDNAEGFTVSSYSSSQKSAWGIGNWKPNVAYLRVFCDDVLIVDHNPSSSDKGIYGHWRDVDKHNKRIGIARCCGRVYYIDVKNFMPGDSLLFKCYNGGGPGYWGGHMFLNGKFIPFNKASVKIVAMWSTTVKKYLPTGKYLGCYRDSRNRRMQGTGNRRHENCQDIALRANRRFFGLQHGGYCSISNDWRKTTSYGRVPDRYCSNQHIATRIRDKRVRWSQAYGSGGPWTNAVYDTKRPADIFYTKYGNFANRWLRNANRRGRTLMMPGVRGLMPFRAGRERDIFLWRYVVFQYKHSVPPPPPPYPAYSPPPPEKQPFCPDIRYTEFNSAGCANPSSTKSCIQTVYPTHKVKMSECVHKFRVDGQDYDNEDFYRIISEAVEIVKKNKGDKNTLTSLKNQFRHVARLCCSILNWKDEDENLNDCRRKSANLDVGYLNELIQEALDQSDKHAMKNGKTANTFLRSQLKSDIKTLISLSRKMIGHYKEQCNCKRFGNSKKDPANDRWYRCSTGGTYATYNHNTLTPGQVTKAKQLWRGRPASYYACVQGCGGKCISAGRGIMANVPEVKGGPFCKPC